MTEGTAPKKKKGFYIQLYSIHGLVRGHDLELGRNADTGGQIKYVLELANFLSNDPRVDKIEIVTGDPPSAEFAEMITDVLMMS